MQDGITIRVAVRTTKGEEADTWLRLTEQEKDDFFRKRQQKLRELTNNSRTSLTQTQSADVAISTLLDRIDEEKLKAFPCAENEQGQSVARGLEVFGNHGDSSPQKSRKRGRI